MRYRIWTPDTAREAITRAADMVESLAGANRATRAEIAADAREAADWLFRRVYELAGEVLSLEDHIQHMNDQ